MNLKKLATLCVQRYSIEKYHLWCKTGAEGQFRDPICTFMLRGDRVNTDYGASRGI